MIRFIVRRLLLMIPTLIGITILIQLLMIVTPGDPVDIMMGSNYTKEEKEAFREELGLNDPIHIRYINYLKDMFLHGDFGTSFRTKTPALQEILKRYSYTILLVSTSMVLAICIGIPIGIFAATHQNTWKDNAAIIASLFCVSMPSFWFALILIQLLCVRFELLPVSGVDTWKGWVLPVFTLALGYAASIARQMRSNMLEIIRQDFITTARSKGQTITKVRYKHALKNAVIPVIMTVGSTFGIAIGGSMVTEVIFSLPGLGSYTFGALTARDYPVIQTSVLFLSVVFAFVLLLVDIAFALVDPRIRAQYARKKKKMARRAAL